MNYIQIINTLINLDNITTIDFINANINDNGQPYKIIFDKDLKTERVFKFDEDYIIDFFVNNGENRDIYKNRDKKLFFELVEKLNKLVI